MPDRVVSPPAGWTVEDGRYVHEAPGGARVVVRLAERAGRHQVRAGAVDPNALGPPQGFLVDAYEDEGDAAAAAEHLMREVGAALDREAEASLASVVEGVVADFSWSPGGFGPFR